MEQQLDRKIKDTYYAKDENTSFANSELLWNRISTEMGHKKGIPAFWKVAAIFLVLLSFGGIFAAVSLIKNQNEKIIKIEIENVKLQIVVDSLMNIKPEKFTEIQIVEKEKLVYKEIFVPVEKERIIEYETKKADKYFFQLTQQLNNTISELQITKDSLTLTLTALDKLKRRVVKEQQKNIRNFKLKTQMIETQMRPTKSESSPKIKLQIFKLQEDNLKYDINSTIFKK